MHNTIRQSKRASRKTPPNELYIVGSGQLIPTFGPKHRGYISLPQRIRSFDKLKRTNLLKKKKIKFARAGFFHAPDRSLDDDTVTCFYCDESIYVWEENDNPFIEHAVVSPFCTYLILNKGTKFIDECKNSPLDCILKIQIFMNKLLQKKKNKI